LGEPIFDADEPHDVIHRWEKAREIGRLAAQSRSADVRLQLFEVAELFRPDGRSREEAGEFRVRRLQFGSRNGP